MNVFHFILDHRVGGPHTYVRGITQFLSPVIRSTIVTTDRGPMTDWALTNFRHRARQLYPAEVVINFVRICWHFRRVSMRRDVIFDVHGAANIAPVFAARVLGIPLVWHFHETVANFISLAELGKKAAAGIAHRFVVVASRSMDVFGLADAILIPGAVDPEFWKSEHAAEADGSPLRLLAVANLNPLKGLDVLLAALEQFDGSCELSVVGAELQTYAGYANDLRAQAARLAGSGRNVEFAGWKSPEMLRGLMARSEVFILASRSEACPIALLEAMAASCACVATDVGDVAKVLSDPGSGVVVASETPSALANALKYVAALGPEGRRHMGNRARDRIVTDYSLQTMAARHLELYSELAEEVRRLN